MRNSKRSNHRGKTDSSTRETPAEGPRAGRLLSAALAGLLSGGAAACGADGGEASKVIKETKIPDMTFARFTSECDARGGLVQTHAVCSGNNSCKGMSYNKYDNVLTEHSCKAANTCGGMSCVVLPPDKGAPAAGIFAKDCSGCHDHGGKGTFVFPVPPGTDLGMAEADWPNRSRTLQVMIVAFGTRGHNANGTAYANMPAFHEAYSRAEIERVVDHVRALPVVVEEYGIVGQTEDIEPAKE